MLYKKKLIYNNEIKLRFKHKLIDCYSCDCDIKECYNIIVYIFIPTYRIIDKTTITTTPKPLLYATKRESLCNCYKRSLYYVVKKI
jgi:hypothetical protein